MRALLGMAVLVGILYALSTRRKAVEWRTVGGALVLQFFLAILVLKVPGVKDAFSYVAELFVVLIGYTDRGTDFLLGSFGMEGKVDVSLENFAFRLLPTIVFFSAFSALLHFAGILPLFTSNLAAAAAAGAEIKEAVRRCVAK